jgi:hypothetical protein
MYTIYFYITFVKNNLRESNGTSAKIRIAHQLVCKNSSLVLFPTCLKPQDLKRNCLDREHYRKINKRKKSGLLFQVSFKRSEESRVYNTFTMGQCAIIPHIDYYGQDDDLSIATLPTDPTGAAWPLFATSDAGVGGGNINKTFLKLHRPDTAAKCILGHAQVLSALKFQADEFIKIRDGIHQEEENENNSVVVDDAYSDEEYEASRIDTSSVFTGVQSTFAPSVMTTGTAATRPMGNLDKHDARLKRSSKKFSVLANLNEASPPSFLEDNKDDEDDSARFAPSRRISEDIRKNLARASRKLEKLRAQGQPQHGIHGISEAVFGCFPQTGTEIDVRRGKYLTVLHLTMKAHLIDFYQNRYLPMFPNAPTPPGLSKPQNENSAQAAPTLVGSETSDTCSSSGTIDFGVVPSTDVNFLANDSVFMDLAITGSLGLIPRHQRSRPTPPAKNNQKSADHYVVLMNRRSGVPLAVCALRAGDGPPIVRMYATKPRAFGQRQAATTKQLGLDWTDSLPLYSWAEIVTEGEFPQPVHYSIYMSSGSDGRFSAWPSYRAAFLANGSPDIKLVGKTDSEHFDTGCALLTIRAKENGEEPCFQVSIAQGVDPALLICFTAVVDELLECSMRSQCRNHGERAIRRARETRQQTS